MCFPRSSILGLRSRRRRTGGPAGQATELVRLAWLACFPPDRTVRSGSGGRGNSAFGARREADLRAAGVCGRQAGLPIRDDSKQEGSGVAPFAGVSFPG
jgi:hypothetical protein